MMNLLDSSTGVPPSAILAIYSNNVATIATVIATSTRKAAAATATLRPGASRIAPTITTRTEAQDESNRLNLNCQAGISAKEGTATAVTDNVGSDVTDIVIRKVNGDNFKGIDDYELQKIFSAKINGADPPSANTVLEQLASVLRYAFNFQQKVITNMELLQARVARLQLSGITINGVQLTLALLANIECAKHEDYGHKFRPSLQNIRRTFPYNHVHDAASLMTVL